MPSVARIQLITMTDNMMLTSKVVPMGNWAAIIASVRPKNSTVEKIGRLKTSRISSSSAAFVSLVRRPTLRRSMWRTNTARK